MSSNRDRVTAENILALWINDHDLRVQIFLVLGHGQTFLAGSLVGLGLNSNPRDHVAEFNLTARLSNNGD